MQSFLQSRRLRDRVTQNVQRETANSEIREDGDEQVIIMVSSNGDDSTDPRSWSAFHRYRAIGIVCLLVFAQGWVATCDSTVVKLAAKAYNVSPTAETLSTATFMVGLSAGALFAGPLSETVGRNPMYLASTAAMMALTLGAALAPDYGAQLAFRFLGGIASSPSLSIYGGTLADLFDDKARRAVWPVFSISPLLGPVVAPVAGGWISTGRVDWRWTLWIGLIMVFASFTLALLALPETFGPILLKQKAHHLRKITNNARFTAPVERGPTLRARLITNIPRPVTFFSSEPIVIFLDLYLVLIFVINFTPLSGFEYILDDTYALSPRLSSLNFVSIAVGVLIDVALTPLYSRLADRVHRRQFRAFVVRKMIESSTSLDSEASSHAHPIVQPPSPPQQVSSDTPPELSLLRAAIAAPFLPAALFWLGWTNDPRISPASGYAATVVFGYSFEAIFIDSYQYVIESYEIYALSALASITVARYVVSSGMIVATRPMYEGIGVHWTSTLLGLVALALVPVPWVLLRYGDRVRTKSKFASEVAG